MKGLKYFALFSLICLTILVGLDFAKPLSATSTKIAEPLPTVGSYENLKKILQEAQKNVNYGMMRSGLGANQMLESAKAAMPSSAADSGTSMDTKYSQTNAQVEGVDEADTVKTDGEYIYKISNNQVIIAKAYPAEEMKIISTLDYGTDMYPIEMYVDRTQLTVILNSHNYMKSEKILPGEGNTSEKRIYPPIRPFENSVKVMVYDVSSKSKPKKVREVEVDGGYVSSRKIDNNLYLVNNKYLPYHILTEPNQEIPTPSYRDSAEGDEIKKIGYDQICYFPGSPEPNYLIVAGINLDTLSDKKTEVQTYLGSGQNIYVSLNSLYVAVAEYKYEKPNTSAKAEPVSSNTSDVAQDAPIQQFILPMPVAMEVNTSFYKFSLNDGIPSYQGKGTVTGRILNQFSMDEHNGYFRTATTVEEYTTSDVKMTNYLFVLDSQMNTVGRIENIAPGERIYSARFMGDRGYMVTFRTVDPLFVIDLKNPNDPKILGELKIPGYSNYLHPYDENHIVGFGKEAIEVEEPHWSGTGTMKNAYYLGMKVALFDVSDVKNPKEKFKIEIGDRGTDSELLYNHKALLFSKDKNLMAFPITVCKIDPSKIEPYDYLAKKDPRLAYGQPIFQGAMVYTLSPDSGFKLKGSITHHQPGNLLELQKNQRYDYNRDISRVLYIDDTLYTISNGFLQANDLGTMEEKGGIKLLN